MSIFNIEMTTGQKTIEMIRYVKENLALSTSQLAKTIGVSRQKIRDYQEGEEPITEKLDRLKVLNSVAAHWTSLDAGSLSGKVDLPYLDGASILELLTREVIDQKLVIFRLEQIASHVHDTADSPFAPRPSILETLMAMGATEPSAEEKFLNREERKIRDMMKAHPRASSGESTIPEPKWCYDMPPPSSPVPYPREEVLCFCFVYGKRAECGTYYIGPAFYVYDEREGRGFFVPPIKTWLPLTDFYSLRLNVNGYMLLDRWDF